MLVFITVMIGLRYQVGADWFNYIDIIDRAKGAELNFIFLNQGDPAYQLLNWVGANIFGDIYFVNTICGFLFSIGMLYFCRTQPRPWLALVVAIPYLVIVVAMGYSRQGVAVGLGMLALVFLLRGQLLIFVVVVTLAATFHKSAIILLPLAIISRGEKLVWRLFGIVVIGTILFLLLLQESLEALTNEYLFSNYESSGTSIRMAMNIVPAALFLMFRNRFKMDKAERSLWVLCSILAFIFPIILFISPSSTPVDRIALYIIPMQIMFYSRFPDIITCNFRRKIFMTVGIIIYSGVVLYIWLNQALNAYKWLPYRNNFFEILFGSWGNFIKHC